MSIYTVQAVHPKFMKVPVFVVPRYDELRQAFIVGKEEYKAVRETRANNEVVFSNNDNPGGVRLEDTMTGFPVYSGNEYDDSDPQHAFLLEIIRESPFIAPSRAEFNPGSSHRLFLHSQEKEAIVTSRKADLVFEALQLIKDRTATDHRSLAYYMGQRVKEMSEQEIEGYVKHLAVNEPARVVEALNDEVYKVRVFLQMLLEKRILTRSGEQVLHGKVPIGADLDGAVLFIRDPKNSTLVGQWKDTLGLKQPSKPAKPMKPVKAENPDD